mgnify:CR=1 FL=1
MDNWAKAVVTTIVTTVMAALTTAVRRLWTRQKCQNARQLALEEGLKGLLHDKIYEMHERCQAKEYISIEELDNLEYIYKPYAALNGNSTGEHMYNAMRAMPNKPPQNEVE